MVWLAVSGLTGSLSLTVTVNVNVPLSPICGAKCSVAVPFVVGLVIVANADEAGPDVLVTLNVSVEFPSGSLPTSGVSLVAVSKTVIGDAITPNDGGPVDVYHRQCEVRRRLIFWTC